MFQKLKGQLLTVPPKFNMLENIFILPVNSSLSFRVHLLRTAETRGSFQQDSANTKVSLLPQKQSSPLKTTEDVNKCHEDSSDKI